MIYIFYSIIYREGLKLFLHPQVLDGFLLVLTADGTILYVSDNVLQYLGYNQVRTNTFTLPTTLSDYFIPRDSALNRYFFAEECFSPDVQSVAIET